MARFELFLLSPPRLQREGQALSLLVHRAGEMG